MKQWFVPVIGMILFVSPAAAGPSALALGYCVADFDVCYNNCRISYPERSFAGDRARVICGQNCYKQRQQCEARAGGMVRATPQPIAPLPAAPQPVRPTTPSPSPATAPRRDHQRQDLRRAYPLPGTVQRAPAGVAGSAPAQRQTTTTPASTIRAQKEEKESGFLGWFKRPEKKKPMIPGKR